MGRGRGTWDARTPRRGTQGRGEVGLGDAGTRGRGDVGTRGCDKQTTPEFSAEIVMYNFRWSRERY